MFLTAVPRLAVNPAPLTSRSLMSVTVSPACNAVPLQSRVGGVSSSDSEGPAESAHDLTSSARYSISSRSFAQLSPKMDNCFNWRHAITCTAGTWLHMLSFKQRQWFAVMVSGCSICPRQVAQIITQLSGLSLASGGT